MSRSRKRPPVEDHEGGDGGGGHGGGGSGRWLVSYSDFITLMMVVFMVLYSMARVDSGKYAKLKSSLQHSSIGIQPLPVGGNPVNTAPTMPGSDPLSAPGQPAPADPTDTVAAPPTAVIPPAPASAPAGQDQAPTQAAGSAAKQEPAVPAPQDSLSPLRDSLQGTAAARAGSLRVAIEDRGLVISILTQVLFTPGTTDLKPQATALLDEVSTRLKSSAVSILVEGSPDADASKAPWDLAVRRASTVVGYLVNTRGLAADRFAVLGYGKGDGVSGIVNVVVLRRQ